MLQGRQRAIVLTGFLLVCVTTVFFAPYRVVTRVSDVANSILSATGSNPSREEFTQVMHSPLFADHTSKAIEARIGGTFPPTVLGVEIDTGRMALYWTGILLTTAVAAMLVPKQ
jgi:hypothetical protein